MGRWVDEWHRLVLKHQPGELLAVYGRGVEVGLEVQTVGVGGDEEDGLAVRPSCVLAGREARCASWEWVG